MWCFLFSSVLCFFFFFFFFFFFVFWGGGGWGGFFVSKTVKMNIFTFSSMLRKWVTSSQSYSFRELICAIILALTFLTCWLVPQWILQSECWFEFDWWQVQLEPECLSYIVFGISGNVLYFAHNDMIRTMNVDY